MKILFICRFNRFRSVLAEGLFKKLNKNKKHKAKSAGLIKGSQIDKNTKQIAKDLKIKIKAKPQTLSSKILAWQDMIVIIADNVSLDLFEHQKYIKKMKVYKIHDAKSDYHAKAVAKKVERAITEFVDGLK